MRSHELREAALPHLQRLSDETDQTVNLAVRDGAEIVYLARLKRPGLLDIKLYVGSRLPVHATSLGRAMLARLPADELAGLLDGLELTSFTEHTITGLDELRQSLERVRADGYAFNDQELALGLRGVAVPVLDSTGYPRAAINLAIAAPVSKDQLTSELVPRLQRTAADVADALAMIPTDSW